MPDHDKVFERIESWNELSKRTLQFFDSDCKSWCDTNNCIFVWSTTLYRFKSKLPSNNYIYFWTKNKQDTGGKMSVRWLTHLEVLAYTHGTATSP